MNKQDDARFPLAFDPGDEPLTRRFQESLLDHRLQSGKDKKPPKNVASRHLLCLQ
jgi:hypothetical protein